MRFIECNNYLHCEAPLCPLVKAAGETWFPDEDICSRRESQSVSFIQAQKKIQKRAKDSKTFYTLAMLDRGCTIKSGITGLNPDSDIPEEEQEARWLAKHKPARIWTAAEKAKVTERLRSTRQNPF